MIKGHENIMSCIFLVQDILDTTPVHNLALFITSLDILSLPISIFMPPPCENYGKYLYI
jgi:hypothetical protein